MVKNNNNLTLLTLFTALILLVQEIYSFDHVHRINLAAKEEYTEDYFFTVGDWQASYFNNSELKGDATFLDKVQKIYFDYGKGSIETNTHSSNLLQEPIIKKNFFSAKFQGLIQVYQSGKYIFKTVHDDGVRVYLTENNQKYLLINEWDSNINLATSFPILLEQGKNYEILIEYREITGDAKLYFWLEKYQEL